MQIEPKNDLPYNWYVTTELKKLLIFCHEQSIKVITEMQKYKWKKTTNAKRKTRLLAKLNTVTVCRAVTTSPDTGRRRREESQNHTSSQTEEC